jgi:hypothetical protein
MIEQTAYPRVHNDVLVRVSIGHGVREKGHGVPGRGHGIPGRGHTREGAWDTREGAWDTRAGTRRPGDAAFALGVDEFCAAFLCVL